MAYEAVAELYAPDGARVFEHGWQSWSPSTTYDVGDAPARPSSEANRMVNWRIDSTHAARCFQGEGLLAVQVGDLDGPVHVFGARDATVSVPTIRAESAGAELRISADGAVECTVDTGPGGLEGALARWADGVAARIGGVGIRSAPSIWCSWYHYFTDVTPADVIENMAAITQRDLPIDTIQLDDGYQAGYGDWLVDSDRFGSTRAVIGEIRDAGFGAGIWTAPFTVGAHSRLAAEHPEWLVREPDGRPARSGFNWAQDLYCLDATHPGAQEYLGAVYRTLASWGVGLHKLDFLYAGAVPGRRHDDVTGVVAYRRGMQLIRRAAGPTAHVLGCGAPILPSVGLVDAMRVSPDTAAHHEPVDGDLGTPSSRAAIMTGRARAFQQGRFWINDPDCLLVAPHVQHREQWADHVRRFGGLRGSSDRIADLDDWGLATVAELLGQHPTAAFIPS